MQSFFESSSCRKVQPQWTRPKTKSRSQTHKSRTFVQGVSLQVFCVYNQRYLFTTFYAFVQWRFLSYGWYRWSNSIAGWHWLGPLCCQCPYPRQQGGSKHGVSVIGPWRHFQGLQRVRGCFTQNITAIQSDFLIWVFGMGIFGMHVLGFNLPTWCHRSVRCFLPNLRATRPRWLLCWRKWRRRERRCEIGKRSFRPCGDRFSTTISTRTLEATGNTVQKMMWR